MWNNFFWTRNIFLKIWKIWYNTIRHVCLVRFSKAKQKRTRLTFFIVFYISQILIKVICVRKKFSYMNLNYNSKLNSNPYHYNLKFPSTSKQKYNSKFQEFETVQILRIQKKRPNLDQKTLPKINKHEKNQQKRRKEKNPISPWL